VPNTGVLLGLRSWICVRQVTTHRRRSRHRHRSNQLERGGY